MKNYLIKISSLIVITLLLSLACVNEEGDDSGGGGYSPITDPPFTNTNEAGESSVPAGAAYSAVDETNWITATWKLGANYNGSDVEFAVFSEHGTKVLLEIYDAKSNQDAKYDYWMKKNTSDNIWRAKLKDIPSGTLYGYRVWGPNWEYKNEWKRGNSNEGFKSDVDTNGNRFNPNKVLFDPYAKEISHDKSNPTVLGSHNVGIFATGAVVYNGVVRREFDTGKYAPKSVVVKDATSTGNSPGILEKDAIIYEAHVRGITNHPSTANLQSILNTVGITATDIPSQYRGTYKGATYLIPYFQSLGINTIELLPVHETDNDANPDNGPGGNYWGYMTYGFFAPDRRYSSDKSYGGPTKEFKEMVAAFHEKGIQIYLDVVYNHSGEGGTWGGASNDTVGNTAELTFLRGFDNSVYYYSETGKPNFYWDSTGCGNNLKCYDPQVRKFILDSLTYWIDKMGVDGFRFDLAPVLGREPGSGWIPFNANATTLLDINQLGISKNVKMIAEAWDTNYGDGYHVGEFPGAWAEWNGRYRDAVRKFIMGVADTGITSYMNGDYYYFNDQGGPHKSINFIVAHDGVTLADLVSYGSNESHWKTGEWPNEIHGGLNYNLTWPFGPSDGGGDNNTSSNYNDAGGDIQKLRRQQLRNLFTIQMFSRGVPMIVWGDEFGRTQRGQNNPYCIDSVATWSNYNQINTKSPQTVATGGSGLPYKDNIGTFNKTTNINGLFMFVRNIMNLRANSDISDILRSDNYSTDYTAYDDGYGYGEKTKRVWLTIGAGTYKYLVCVNSSPSSMWNINLPDTTGWYKIIDTDHRAEVNDNFWTGTAGGQHETYGIYPRSTVVFKKM